MTRSRNNCSFLGGFKLTFQHLTRPRVTTMYPEEKKPKQPRQHGRHVLNRYEDGMEKCIGCELCAGVCPADCIYVRGLDNPPDHPVSPGERYGYVYEINYLRCIHCDMCVEACPTEAITESKLFEFSFTNRSDAIYTKGELLVDDQGIPQKLPWEDWREGDDMMTSGWMRATAASGSAAYAGEVQWSGELATACAPPRAASRPPRRRGHRVEAAAPGARVHLLDEDIPLAHRGMQGRVWRAKKGGRQQAQEDGGHPDRIQSCGPRRPRRAKARRPTPPRRRRPRRVRRPSAGGDRRRRGERLTHAPRRAPPALHTRAAFADILVLAALSPQ